MEQALISCFGEMADERTDMQISCAGKNNPRRLHMQTSTIAPASEADLRMGLALKMPEGKAQHKSWAQNSGNLVRNLPARFW